MGNNENIFSPVTNWEIEVYGNSKKKLEFYSSHFWDFLAISSRNLVFDESGKDV